MVSPSVRLQRLRAGDFQEGLRCQGVPPRAERPNSIWPLQQISLRRGQLFFIPDIARSDCLFFFWKLARKKAPSAYHRKHGLDDDRSPEEMQAEMDGSHEAFGAAKINLALPGQIKARGRVRVLRWFSSEYPFCPDLGVGLHGGPAAWGTRGFDDTKTCLLLWLSHRTFSPRGE